MPETVYLVHGLEQVGPDEYEEHPRRVFEDKESCEEYLESEIHGGRYHEIPFESEDYDA